MEQTMIEAMYTVVPNMLTLAKKPVWFDYDQGADVLYVSFRRPQEATETIPVDDHVLRREREGELVGFTILHASRIASRRQSKVS